MKYLAAKVAATAALAIVVPMCGPSAQTAKPPAMVLGMIKRANGTTPNQLLTVHVHDDNTGGDWYPVSYFLSGWQVTLRSGDHWTAEVMDAPAGCGKAAIDGYAAVYSTVRTMKLIC